MSRSPLSLPLRLTLRGARTALRTTRDAAELGLTVVDLFARMLDEHPSESDFAEYEEFEDLVYVDVPADDDPRADDGPPVAEPAVAATSSDAEEPIAPLAEILEGDTGHVDEGIELVGESADLGVEDGAGATIRIDPPLAGYDALRGPDVIARLPGADAATLAAIELYEQTHRRRRTVLDAIARESRRRG